jgi:hypothetical protein
VSHRGFGGLIKPAIIDMVVSMMAGLVLLTSDGHKKCFVLLVA